MKTLFWLSAFLAAFPARAEAGEIPEALDTPYSLIRGTVAAPAGAPAVPWYPERLQYEIKWGIFSVGTSDMEVRELVDFNGTAAYRIVSRARSNAFADRFYKVDDLNESWLDAGRLRSLGYLKQLREGRFFRDEWTLYDYDKLAFLSKRINKEGEVSVATGTLPGASVQDILSSLYCLRPGPLKVGDELTLDVNTRSNWPLTVKVLAKESLSVPAGTFRTLRVEPFLREEGIFVQKGKRLQVWLTDDERHIPVFMRVEIVFGHVSAYLTKIGK